MGDPAELNVPGLTQDDRGLAWTPEKMQGVSEVTRPHVAGVPVPELACEAVSLTPWGSLIFFLSWEPGSQVGQTQLCPFYG